MSTFYGGEEIVNVLAVSASRTGSGVAGGNAGTTIGYVVPADRYALVQLVSASTSGVSSGQFSAAIGSFTIVSASASTDDSTNLIDFGFQGWFLLTEGETIRATITTSPGSGNVNVSAKIKEFVSPN